jgi:hypothetical protein
MSIDSKISEALEQAASGAHRQPGAWNDVQRRIGRSNRRRIVAASIGAAVAVTAGIVALLPQNKNNGAPITTRPGPTTTWVSFQSKADGFRINKPADWNAKRDASTDVTTVVPADASRIGRQPAFAIEFVVQSGVYTDPKVYRNKAPEYQVDEGMLAGKQPYVRVMHRASQGSVSVLYSIDWTTPLCKPGAPCPRPPAGKVLQATISAASESLYARYGAIATLIVKSISAISAQVPAGPPMVVAQLPVEAFDVAIGPDAVWALERTGQGRAGKLLRIDPATNRTTASIDVGVWPTAVAANAEGIWVTNGTLDGYASTYPSQNSVMRIDPRTDRVVATIRVSKPLDVGIISRGTAVWVAAAGESSTPRITLVGIDPQTNAVYKRIGLPGTDESSDLAIGQGPSTDRRDVVWVTTSPVSTGGPDKALLNHVDAEGRLKTFEIPGGQFVAPISTGFGSVWVGVSAETTANAVARFDTETERVTSTISLPSAAPIGLNSISTGESYVWAVGGRGSLWRIDPATNERVGDPLTLGDNPPTTAGSVVYGFGSLWVATGEGEIWRLEP